MSCSSCHAMHAKDAAPRTVDALNTACVKCHQEQRGPWVFEHEAVAREGCVSCHKPHGSINPKMTTERDYNLCLKCHFSAVQYQSIGHYAHRRALNPSSLGVSLTNCMGCHRAVHGSNFSKELRTQ